MLISIHSSVVDDGDENTWDDETLRALQNLATARREGKHSVIAERETLTKIARCSRLFEITRNVYKHLSNQATQNFRSYPSVVKRYIEIVKPCLEPQVVDNSGKKIIKVPPGFFNDSKLVQETILLCENSNDSVLYETIAKVYLIWNKINVQIVCDRRGGGGNTISSVYINLKKEKKCFCLCIVDSDKIAPDGKLGSTASGLPQSDSSCTNTQTFILDCREIENLIPNSILSKLCLGNEERVKALRIFEKISKSAVDIRYFLDIKKGTRLKEIIQASNPNIKSFWETKLSLIPDISSCIDDWCQANWQCSNSGECQCKISLGFGESTLSNTVDYLKQESPHEIARIVDRSQHSDWEQIGQVVMDWCIAESPIRA